MFREDVLSCLGGCFNGEPASCSFACPFRMDMRAFLKKAAKGRWDAAYKEMRTYIPFPEIAAAFCKGHCEGACQHKTVVGGEPIAVRRIERAVIDLAKRKEGAFYAIPPRGESVAIVGAGPAGLACALLLGQKKFRVVVFDSLPGWGGSLRSRDDFAVFESDFKTQLAPVEVEFRFGHAVTSLDELKDFDAVYIATGSGGDTFGLEAGWDKRLGATAVPGAFLGGEAVGLGLVEGMALSCQAARGIESFLQTGKPDSALGDWNAENACRFIPHGDAAPSACIRPAGESYTSDEAKAEAARCMQCDCTECMDSCELLPKYNKKPPRIASDVIQDGQSRNSVSTASITRETWSCNLCGRCSLKCQEKTDIAGIFQASRKSRVDTGYYPPAIHAYWLREMAQAAGEAALSIAGGGEYIFFPGCRLGASNPEYVIKSYELLREKLGCGVLLDCCGAPAYWAGEDRLLHEHTEKLHSELARLGSRTLIAACPSCTRMLNKLLPDVRIVSLYTVLDELGVCGSFAGEEMSVFDPCAASGDDGTKKAVRTLAEKSGAVLNTFDPDGKCCGFGGHMMLAAPKLYREIAASRSAESTSPYVVYCANCFDVFKTSGKNVRHILDIVFGLDTEKTTLEEKRRNRLRLKQALSGAASGQEPEKNPWDELRVDYSPDVLLGMELSLIPMGDVLETVWYSENGGDGFDDGNGDVLTWRVFGHIVVWVEYRRETDEKGVLFRLNDVYSHRMKVRKES